MASLLKQLLHPFAPRPAQRVEPGPFDIKVLGDERFAAVVRDALELVSTNCPDYHEVVTGHVAAIESAERKPARHHEEPPRIALASSIDFGRDLSPRSKAVWYAGAIVHQAWHSKLYREFRLANPGAPWPADERSAAEREDARLQAQVDALVRMGASMWMLDHVRSRIGLGPEEPADRGW
jgi:hypothetical protein